MSQSREITQRNVDHLYGQFNDVLVYLNGQALDSKREEIRARLENLLKIVSQNAGYKEGISRLNGMKHGVIRILLIVIFFVIAIPFYGQAGGAGNSAPYGSFRYVTTEKMDVKIIMEYMNIFQEKYCKDFDKMRGRKGAYFNKLTINYYFQNNYIIKYNPQINMEIEISYKKYLFSLNKKYIIEIKFHFNYFPAFEDDGFTERYVYDIIIKAVKTIIYNFDRYASDNNISLLKL